MVGTWWSYGHMVTWSHGHMVTWSHGHMVTCATIVFVYPRLKKTHTIYIMSKRWSADEKIQMMKLYSKGKSFADIGTTLDRSANAIKLSLEKVVYDNLTKGKTMPRIAHMLGTNHANVKQLYYSHKSFLEARGTPTINIDFDKPNKVSRDKVSRDKVPRDKVPRNKAPRDKVPSKVPRDKAPCNKAPRSHTPTSGLVERLDRLEEENRYMEIILQNYKLKRQLEKLKKHAKHTTREPI